MRLLVLIHRYLGIAIGFVMAAWCLSGVVMMYVGYPALTHAERLQALAPIDLRSCCSAVESVLADDDTLTSFQLEMMTPNPVLRLQFANGSQKVVDATTGRALPRVTPNQALHTAQAYGAYVRQSPAPTLDELIEYDQWTIAGIAKRERPLYRIALNDSAGTQLYVSSVTGRAVQSVTAHERLWNWLGAIPHWLYFAELRHNARLWRQVVIWTSLLGCFLTAAGFYLGMQRFIRRPRGRGSPFRGLLLWHHVPGIVFGIFALTWVASGLLSMNPWGFLDSAGTEQAAAAFSGAQVKESLRALAVGAPEASALARGVPVGGAPPADVVSIDSVPFGGQLYLMASRRDGARTRLDAHGSPAPLTHADVVDLLKTLGGASAPELLTREDAYYFTHHRDIALLPAYRAILGDTQKTRLYIDPLSGVVLSAVDSNSRWYRWLHEGLHRMDFTSALRSRPVWDLLMLFLMSGVATVCCTGAVLGIRRLVS